MINEWMYLNSRMDNAQYFLSAIYDLAIQRGSIFSREKGSRFTYVMFFNKNWCTQNTEFYSDNRNFDCLEQKWRRNEKTRFRFRFEMFVSNDGHSAAAFDVARLNESQWMMRTSSGC